MDQSTSTSGPTPTEVALALKPYTVTFKKGGTDQVFLRVLDVEEFDLLTKQAGSLARLAELYCGQKLGWAKGITSADVYAIVREGRRMNANPFSEWWGNWSENQEEMRSLLGISQNSLALPPTTPALPAENS